MKLNRKGYMLVEIVVASVLAVSIAYYLLNLTYRFKDSNEDLYHSITNLTDKILVTKNIMLDLENGSVSNIEKENNTNIVTFTIKLNNKNIEEKRKLFIYNDNDNRIKIQYGKVDEFGVFDINDASYYEKTFEATLIIEEIEINDTNNNLITIEIPMHSIYGEEDYSIKLAAKVYDSVNEVETPTSCTLLSEKKTGSYIKYGTNEGVASCVTITSVGFLDSSYISTDWRLAYVEDGKPHIINAGAARCYSLDKTFEEVTAQTASVLHSEANEFFESHCIDDYIDGGKCSNTTQVGMGNTVDREKDNVWAMENLDFEKIMNNNLKVTDCIDSKCELANEEGLINNGGDYWIFPDSEPSGSGMRRWSNENKYFDWLTPVEIFKIGIRFVNRLDSNVCVISGSGTKDDPYVIK